MTADEIKALLEEADAYRYNRPLPRGMAAVSLIVALAELVRELTEWRPMETAPRDGTQILVLTPPAHHDIVLVEWKDRAQAWVADAGAGRLVLSGSTVTLGWLPLPEAPR